MNEDARKRLEGFLYDLMSIDEKSPDNLRCAVVSSTLTSPLRDPAAWQWVAEFIRRSRDPNLPLVPDLKLVVVEPFMDGKGCIRWCGKDDKREAFKAWVDRFSAFINANPEVVPDFEPRDGIEGGLQALCAVAGSEPRLSALVKRRTILNLNEEQDPFDTIPAKLDCIRPKPSFDVAEIDGMVLAFSLKALKRLLGRPIGEPPLSVNIPSSEVTVHGKVYPLDLKYVHFVDQLLRANGETITRRMMRDNCRILADEEHLERLIEPLEEMIKIKVDRVARKGFRLPPEWLG